jgi:hypothetical protein
MPIAKRKIVELLLARRDHERAIRADEELPELVYVELHHRLLEDLGLDPAMLVRDLGETGRRFERRGPVVRRRDRRGRPARA